MIKFLNRMKMSENGNLTRMEPTFTPCQCLGRYKHPPRQNACCDGPDYFGKQREGGSDGWRECLESGGAVWGWAGVE